MSEKQKVPSLLEIMNDVLSTVRDYYDSEYVYYIERDEDEILTIYEWCAEFIPWQRDRIQDDGSGAVAKVAEAGTFEYNGGKLQRAAGSLMDGGDRCSCGCESASRRL